MEMIFSHQQMHGCSQHRELPTAELLKDGHCSIRGLTFDLCNKSSNQETSRDEGDNNGLSQISVASGPRFQRVHMYLDTVCHHRSEGTEATSVPVSYSVRRCCRLTVSCLILQQQVQVERLKSTSRRRLCIQFIVLLCLIAGLTVCVISSIHLYKNSSAKVSQAVPLSNSSYISTTEPSGCC